jgi:hypothetical protein
MRRRFLALVGCSAALLVTALPATANDKPTTGSQIRLSAPPATFPAATPFFIEGGSACNVPNVGDLNDCMNATSYFDLYLDGVLQQSTVDVDLIKTPVGFFLARRYLTNYPSGLPAGSHTFVGNIFVDGTLFGTLSATITFT